MKHLVGKEVYLRGTGNNARNGKARKIERALVIDAKKVFVTIRLDESTFTRKFRMIELKGRWHLSSEHNSGYDVFETPAEFNAQIEVERLASEIAERCRFATHLYNVKLADLIEVARLLGATGG